MGREKKDRQTDTDTQITENENLCKSSLREYSLKGIIDILMDLKSNEI